MTYNRTAWVFNVLGFGLTDQRPRAMLSEPLSWEHRNTWLNLSPEACLLVFLKSIFTVSPCLKQTNIICLLSVRYILQQSNSKINEVKIRKTFISFVNF